MAYSKFPWGGSHKKLPPNSFPMNGIPKTQGMTMFLSCLHSSLSLRCQGKIQAPSYFISRKKSRKVQICSYALPMSDIARGSHCCLNQGTTEGQPSHLLLYLLIFLIRHLFFYSFTSSSTPFFFHLPIHPLTCSFTGWLEKVLMEVIQPRPILFAY